MVEKITCHLTGQINDYYNPECHDKKIKITKNLIRILTDQINSYIDSIINMLSTKPQELIQLKK